MMPTILCSHGNPVDAIEVTSVSDRRPRYIADMCDCPRPHCPFCQHELDTHGRCASLDCFFVGHLVPIPDVH